jgi:hypothetical protein
MIIRRALLASFIVLFPFYVLPSGVPQPSHAILALACALSAAPIVAMFRTPDRAVLIPLALFIAYTAIVNGYYSFSLNAQDSSLRSLPIARTAYLAFNGGLFAVFLLHMRQGGTRELRFLVACLVGGVAVLAAISMVYPVWHNGRLTASFNNPNQLGYYALIVLTAGLAYSLRGGMSIPVTAAMTAACVYLIARSLSVAAIGALLLTWVLVGIQALRTRRSLAVALLLSFVPLAALGWFTRGEAVLAGLERRSEQLERLSKYFARDRHLTWLIEYPEHLILGAGEGAAERFYTSRRGDTEDGTNGGAEVHSTLGVVLFAYGIPGTALFLLFLWRVVRADPAHALTLVVPLLAYGLAHNGLRFSFFWFCLAVVYCTARVGDLKGEVAPIALWPRRAGAVPLAAPPVEQP